jgi:C-terminal processing protease CtpA/Prc
VLRLISSIIIIAVLALWSFHFVKRSQAKTAIGQVCETVATNFFDTTKNLREWATTCRSESIKSLSRCPTVDGYCISSALNQSFSLLESSHLFISVPEASRRFYRHEALANGLKLRWIADKIVVLDVYKGSPADGSGVQLGDVVISVDDEKPLTLSQVQRAHKLVVDRLGEKLEFQLEMGTFQMDHTPRITPIGPGKAVLRISSFEGQFEDKDLFDEQFVKTLFAQLRDYKGVVIDLRENLGGNFVALLRALSPFLCKATEIGTLQKLGQNPEVLGEFPDSLEFADQWPIIVHSDGVVLKSFSEYGCYRGKIALLVDSDTSSVAEIFAHVLKKELGVPILGHPTAGAVLVALRDEVKMLGPDYYLNMPILTYLDDEGFALEGEGLWPDYQLQYDLESFRRGRDNWIFEAANALNY